MTISKIVSAILLSVLFPAVGLSLQACGEDTPCEKLLAIQKDICKNARDCFPCACYLNNECLSVYTNAFGLPDLDLSHCEKPCYYSECNEGALAWAESCLELGRPEPGDENFQAWVDLDCDPRYLMGIHLFDEDGTPAPAFPEVCAGGW